MSNEIPVIIFLLWILLSTHAGVYCICCQEGQHSTGVGTTEGLVVHQEVIHSTNFEHHHEDDSLLISLKSVANDCHKENFSFLYSILSIFLLLSALFTDLKNYYIALWNRVVTIFLIFLLVTLIVVSPSTCSQFSTTERFDVILRLTFYHILWFVNQYKKITEDTLLVSYTHGMHLIESEGLVKKNRRTKYTYKQTETPISILTELNNTETIPTSSPPRKKKKQYTNLLGASDDEDDDEEGDDNEENRINWKNMEMIYVFKKMMKANEYYYQRLLSWKNRDYNKRIRHIIDVALTVWVLLIIKYWIFFVIPLQLMWLFYQINRNIKEIIDIHKYVKLLSIYSKNNASINSYIV
jgi:hypothetical protein